MCARWTSERRQTKGRLSLSELHSRSTIAPDRYSTAGSASRIWTLITEPMGKFCRRPVYEEFDVCEMSMSWFLAARSRGEPVIGLPIFPLRMPVLAYMFCRADAPYRHPRDLIGCTIATPGFHYTVNLWLRGLLQEHYGLSPEQMTWITGAQEGAGYLIPAGITWRLEAAKTPEELLIAGEADAVFSPGRPLSVQQGDGRIRRLLPDPALEQASLFRESGTNPITHIMVTSERLARTYPGVAASLLDGFRSAQRLVDDFQAEPKNLSFPEAVFLIETTWRTYGTDLWSHGLTAANRRTLETFIRYAHEQGYVAERPSLDSLFPENTLDM